MSGAVLLSSVPDDDQQIPAREGTVGTVLRVQRISVLLKYFSRWHAEMDTYAIPLHKTIHVIHGFDKPLKIIPPLTFERLSRKRLI